MKLLSKRLVAILLALVMCVSLSFGLNFSTVAATNTVDYVYDGDYIYNWGTRGETATFLSQNAESFYEKNNTSYEQLSALLGSSSESGVPSSELYKQLHNLMEKNQSYQTTYNATKELFRYTDCQNSGGKISSFYSGVGIGPGWDGSWNREHTWPNSKGDASGNGENDLMMLRPTSTSENSSRGNKAYGQGSSYYNPNSESDNKYDLRGDVARIVLYVYVRWECTNTGSSYNPNGIFGTDGVMESKEVLLDWIEQDPVDTWELGRNDSAESILGTRNVFVDYPELAFLLYNEDVPADYTSPSGNGESVAYTITATSNNSSWGTVSVSGKTVNATPKTGYEVSGYELLSGEASVTRSGNAFTVVAESDVQIKINFAPRTQKTVSFSEDNGIVSTKTVYTGDEITLPSYSGTVQDGNVFVGWVEHGINETTEIPTYYTAGSKFTVDTSVTLYALYSKTVTDGGTSSNVFEKYSGALTEGDYIITYEGGAMKAATTDKTRLQITDVDDSGNEMIVTDESIIWKLSKNGNYWTFYNVASGKYAAGNGTDNRATLITSVTDYANWTASGTNTYEFVNLGNDSAGKNPLLRRNGTVGFACYAKNTNVGGALTLYKRISGTIYYFTNTTSADVSAGDVNGDGYINNKDLAVLMQYLNEWDVQIDTRAADYNNDGSVNNRDYALIMRYVNS